MRNILYETILVQIFVGQCNVCNPKIKSNNSSQYINYQNYSSKKDRKYDLTGQMTSFNI